jgi:hypothetical protein
VERLSQGSEALDLDGGVGAFHALRDPTSQLQRASASGRPPDGRRLARSKLLERGAKQPVRILDGDIQGAAFPERSADSLQFAPERSSSSISGQSIGEPGHGAKTARENAKIVNRFVVASPMDGSQQSIEPAKLTSEKSGEFLGNFHFEAGRRINSFPLRR